MTFPSPPSSWQTAVPSRAYRLSRTLSRLLSRTLDRHQPSETTVLLGTAILVGALTGLASVAFIKLIAWVGWVGFVALPELAPWLRRGWLIIIPALGALIAGPILAKYVPEARASGIPAVMESLALHGGHIRARVAVLKIPLTALTIGSGGSAGREGPIVQVGAALGSILAQLLRLSETRTRNLLACGAAAGISAAFNAPIAGVAFAIEELGGELGLGMLGNVVIAAAVAAIVSGALSGGGEALTIPLQQLGDPSNIVFYVLLGVIAGLWGVVYIKAFYAANNLFSRRWRRIPAWLRPATGGLLLGLIGFAYPLLLVWRGYDADLVNYGMPVSENLPAIYGAGFLFLEQVLHTPLPLQLAAILLVLKLAGTVLTLGSGSAGGLFAPSLFMGAMLGTVVGQAVDIVFPNNPIDPTAFALAGMAGVLTGAVRAPLTSMLIVFELTNDYAFILPLMATTIVSAIVSHRLHPESIYTLSLALKGIRLRHGRDIDVLDAVLVNDIMGQNPPTIAADATVQSLQAYLDETHHHGVLVVDHERRLVGIVTLQDIGQAFSAGMDASLTPVSAIMTKTMLVAFPDESIGAALQRMAVRDVGRLPVVDRRDPQRILGIIRRSDIVRAYRYGLIQRDDRQDRANQLRISQREGGTEFVELVVRRGSVAAGQRVCDLHLPPETLLTTRRHGDHMQLLHGDHVLEVGDIILALSEPQYVDQLHALFEEKTHGR